MSEKSSSRTNSEDKEFQVEELGKEGIQVVPVPVVLTWNTILKFASAIVLPIIAAISFAILFFHRTVMHMEDPTIHLVRGERAKLETKKEARLFRGKLNTEIKSHIDIKVREIKIEQKEQFHKLGGELKKGQGLRFKEILSEVRKARADIKRSN